MLVKLPSFCSSEICAYPLLLAYCHLCTCQSLGIDKTKLKRNLFDNANNLNTNLHASGNLNNMPVEKVRPLVFRYALCRIILGDLDWVMLFALFSSFILLEKIWWVILHVLYFIVLSLADPVKWKCWYRSSGICNGVKMLLPWPLCMSLMYLLLVHVSKFGNTHVRERCRLAPTLISARVNTPLFVWQWAQRHFGLSATLGTCKGERKVHTKHTRASFIQIQAILWLTTLHPVLVNSLE
jgi:hypothetical protein